MEYRDYLKSLRPVLDRENKFMFFCINKVVQTSINRNLLKDRVLVCKDDPDAWAEKYDRYTDEQLRDIYKFTIVRNPWDKTVSYFFYYKRINNPKVAAYSTFDEFVCKCLRHEGADYDPHLEHQHPKAYFEGTVFVDKIARFEDLTADWQTIARTIGASPNLPHANKSRHKHYSAYYSPESIEIVSQLYAEDINLFGYAFTPKRSGLLDFSITRKLLGKRTESHV